MPSRLLFGATNNGKSSIIERLRTQYAASDNEGGEAISVPIVYVEVPPQPDEKRFYTEILNAIFAKYSYADSAAKLFDNVIDKFEKLNVKMLIIDEFSNLLRGSRMKQRQFLIVMKSLSNRLRIPIVAVGTEESMAAMQTDGQLANRFLPIALPVWDLNREFRRLLASMEGQLPLKHPSNMQDERLAQEILARTDGTIGEITMLIKRAATLAIRSGDEKIDLKILETCGYLAPDERKKAAMEVTLVR